MVCELIFAFAVPSVWNVLPFIYKWLLFSHIQVSVHMSPPQTDISPFQRMNVPTWHHYSCLKEWSLCMGEGWESEQTDLKTFYYKSKCLKTNILCEHWQKCRTLPWCLQVTFFPTRKTIFTCLRLAQWLRKKTQTKPKTFLEDLACF